MKWHHYVIAVALGSFTSLLWAVYLIEMDTDFPLVRLDFGIPASILVFFGLTVPFWCGLLMRWWGIGAHLLSTGWLLPSAIAVSIQARRSGALPMCG